MNLLSKIFPFMFLLIFYKAEAQYTFQKIIRNPNVNVGDAAYDAAIDNDGNIYMIGGSGYQNYGGGIVIKTDSMGNIIWKNFYGPVNGSLFKILYTKDGNLLVLGYYLLNSGSSGMAFFKIDTNGNLLWGKTYNTSLYVGDLIEDSNSNIYLSGASVFIDSLSIQYNSGYILKLDSTANLLWAKHLPEQYFSDFTGMLIINDSMLLVTGEIDTSGNQGGPNRHILLCALDTSGIILWSKIVIDSLVQGGTFIRKLGSTGYLISGAQRPPSIGIYSRIFIKIDLNFNLLWKKKNTNNPGGSIVSAINDPQNNIIFSCNVPGIIKMDTLGNIPWSRGYGNSGFNNILQNVKNYKSGGFILAGSLGANSDMLLVKTDTAGITPCFTFNTNPAFNAIIDATPLTYNIYLNTIDTSFIFSNMDSVRMPLLVDTFLCSGYTGIKEEKSSNFIPLIVIPNPVDDFFRIYFDISIINDKYRISIYNSLGLQVLTLIKQPGESEIEINNISCNSGLMLLQISDSRNKIYSVKIIKLKNY